MNHAGHLRKDLQAAFTVTRGKAAQCSSAARSTRQASPAARSIPGNSSGFSRAAFQSPSQIEGWRVPELWGAANAVAAACRRSFSGPRPDVACQVRYHDLLAEAGRDTTGPCCFHFIVRWLLQAAAAAAPGKPAEGSEDLAALLDFEAKVSPSQVSLLDKHKSYVHCNTSHFQCHTFRGLLQLLCASLRVAESMSSTKQRAILQDLWCFSTINIMMLEIVFMMAAVFYLALHLPDRLAIGKAARSCASAGSHQPCSVHAAVHWHLCHDSTFPLQPAVFSGHGIPLRRQHRCHPCMACGAPVAGDCQKQLLFARLHGPSCSS